MMSEQIIKATIDALKSVSQARFFRTERGYQGQFYCALQSKLDEFGLLDEQAILEMEYQKSRRHNLTQRPDVIFHIPAEDNELSTNEGNFAVYALKRRSKLEEAIDDFKKLDEMFVNLCYPLGFFINIDSDDHLLCCYNGEFCKRVHAFAVKLVNNRVAISYARRIDNEICEDHF